MFKKLFPKIASFMW